MEFKRAFYWSSKAWYRNVVGDDEVMFGMYSKDNGTTGEMAVRWHLMGSKSFPRLEVFDDAWQTLASFGDLIQELGKHNDQNITPEQFVEILMQCGFEDFTPYETVA